jgi:hypothetical protein
MEIYQAAWLAYAQSGNADAFAGTEFVSALS